MKLAVAAALLATCCAHADWQLLDRGVDDNGAFSFFVDRNKTVLDFGRRQVRLTVLVDFDGAPVKGARSRIDALVLDCDRMGIIPAGFTKYREPHAQGKVMRSFHPDPRELEEKAGKWLVPVLDAPKIHQRLFVMGCAELNAQSHSPR